MKAFVVYILHLLLLMVLTIVFHLFVGSLYDEHLWRVFLLTKNYLIADLFTCLPLFFLFGKSKPISLQKTIIICIICFFLTILVGAGLVFYNAWYTNIPEVVMIYMRIGLPMATGNAIASLITCFFTVIMECLFSRKRRRLNFVLFCTFILQ